MVRCFVCILSFLVVAMLLNTLCQSAKNSSLGRPIILTIFQATDVTVENIRMINSPEWFNLVRKILNVQLIPDPHGYWQVNEGENVTYRNVSLSAVSTSKNQAKNTDGWDIFRSNNVVIENSNINNGDDCVSFKPSRYSVSLLLMFLLTSVLDATNILVSNLSCNGSQYVFRHVTSLDMSPTMSISGISVGSLGQYAGEYDIVENVTAR